MKRFPTKSLLCVMLLVQMLFFFLSPLKSHEVISNSSSFTLSEISPHSQKKTTSPLHIVNSTPHSSSFIKSTFAQNFFSILTPFRSFELFFLFNSCRRILSFIIIITIDIFVIISTSVITVIIIVITW